MKRICLRLLLCAAVCLLVAGCGGNAAPASPSPPIVAPMPTETATAWTTPVPGTPTPLPTPIPVYIPGGGLDALGNHSDALTVVPPARYHPGIVHELIPGNQYGEIFPYVGYTWTFTKERYKGEEWTAPVYGICDANGKIVCDPTFHEFKRIETADGKDFYIFTIGEVIAFEPYAEYDFEYYVTNSAGSFVYRCDSYWRLEEAPPYGDCYVPKTNYLTVQNGGKWGVLDTSGRLVLPCDYDRPLFFNEGLAAVVNADGQTYRYIDAQGKTALDGFPCSGFEWENEWLTESDYNFTKRFMFNDGMALCELSSNNETDGYRYGFINKHGKLVFELDEVFTNFNTPFSYYHRYYDNGSVLTNEPPLWVPEWEKGQERPPTQLRNRQGAVLFSTANDDIEFIQQMRDGTLFINQTDGIRVMAKGVDFVVAVENAVVNGYGPLVPGVGVWLRYGRSTQRLNDIWQLLTPEGTAAASFETDEYIGVSGDFTYFVNRNANIVYDLMGRKVPGEYDDWILPVGSLYLVQKEGRHALIDIDGNIIMASVPMVWDD